ncbi:threonine aldolase family protein [Phenylobacterium zucineum HLK1]|uniref:Threonine aldolase family protein n=1 Tax=Phenylobacterium zucineum (strain HLK1) TaxID=450851 RepID=B4RHF8_PHEZH|nr:DSD1 family PLP-dependent enzyme [Phenylobacterium zucineum]ACG77418.1 threonine aldolase family protein [Phenylobacterium zucineum HLK1]
MESSRARLAPHREQVLDLVGRPGSRWRIPTPAAVLDLDAFEANVALMAGRARAAGLALRPHAKSHKCGWVAARQVAAGAAGICCAKLAEAEAMADAGIASILVTSPIAGEAPARRAAALARRLADFRIVVDHPDGVAELAAACADAGADADSADADADADEGGAGKPGAGTPLQVLIDVDVGLGRTGVPAPAQALEVARAVAAAPGLRLIGLQGYGGHWQHVKGAGARAMAVAEGMERLQAVRRALEEAGFPIDVVTGGGTGTFATDAALGVLTEVQPGSYAFMDREYREALGEDPDGAFAQSLSVAATVISANHPKWVTVDAGLKAFATDGPLPQPLTAKFAGCDYRFFGDEHGMLMRPEAPVARGERVELAPGHIDPTLDRYDVLHLVRGEVLEAVVPIEARGASQ